MRKKLLSLLTVLCLVLGMLPATAMAAEYADLAAGLGYSEEEVAMYIDEDTELSEDVEGLVLVVAPVTVTVKGAKLATGLVVVPDAEGAVVTLGESADVNAVIVMAKAEVTVEEKAVAASVTVTAPETKVAVAGEVKTVTVAEEAEKATVTVAETAKVETVEVSAPAAAVEVAGEVATVAVAETAAAATVTVAETAKVTGDVTNAAPDSNVSIKGEVAGSVTTAETAKGATTEVAETAKVTGTVTNAAPDSSMKVEGKVEGGITNTETATGATLEVGEKAEITGEVTDATGEMAVTGDGAGNVTVTPAEPAEGDKKDEEEKKDEGTSDNTFAPPLVIEPTPRPNDAKLVVAPQVDQAEEDPKTNLSTNYDVSSELVSGNTYNVVIYANNVVKHTNAQSNPGYWVGFGIPIKTGEGKPTYKYYALETSKVTESANWGSEIASIASREYTYGDTTYNTVYFDVTDTTPMTLKMTETTGEGDAAQVVEYLFNVTFDVTLVPEETPAPPAGGGDDKTDPPAGDGGDDKDPSNPDGGDNKDPSNPDGGDDKDPSNPNGGDNKEPTNPDSGDNKEPTNPDSGDNKEPTDPVV